MEERERFLSEEEYEDKDEEEKEKLLEELSDLVEELASDKFVSLYSACEKLQRRLDALSEAFYRFCDRHNLGCD